MKPAPFDYVAARSVEEALSLLGDHEREVKPLGGGQSLLPILNLRMGHPDVLVDVCTIPELQRIGVDDAGALHVGAGVRQATVAADERVRSGWPVLAAAIGHIGHPQIRNRGTVCGSLAHSDPASELPAVAVAMGAHMNVRATAGMRVVAAEDFFLGPFTTTLEDGDLLTEVVFPAAAARTGEAFEEFTTRRGDFATVGTVARIVGGDAGIADARVVFFGVGGAPVRVPSAEQMLVGRHPDDETLEAYVAALVAALNPVSDIHASAEFRRELAASQARSVIPRAWKEIA